jgi:tRNA modification GTPase
MTASDTIYALSSGIGRSAVAIMRISGSQTSALLESISGNLPPARRLTLRTIRDWSTGELLDKAMVVWLPGPQLLHGRGLRGTPPPRQPGDTVCRAAASLEVAWRAPRGAGRVHPARLSQWQDGSRGGRRPGGSSRGQDRGPKAAGLSGRCQARRVRCSRAGGNSCCRSGPASRRRWISRKRRVSQKLQLRSRPQHSCAARDYASRTSSTGRRRRSSSAWISCGACGHPNTGKSSLLNALAGREAAIVSDVPGTTRDAIEVTLDLDGMPVIFTDTAGLRAERPIQLSRKASGGRASICQVPIILWVWSADVPGSELPDSSVQPDLAVQNKCDLARNRDSYETIGGIFLASMPNP